MHQTIERLTRDWKSFMADNNKVRIWIQLADANQIALSVNPDEEENYRKAEELVNTLWRKWMNRFKDSSEDVLARVAFQFARLYLEAYGENRQVNEFLTDMDKKLGSLLGDEKWHDATLSMLAAVAADNCRWKAIMLGTGLHAMGATAANERPDHVGLIRI